MYRTVGVRINGKHLYDDFNLVLTSFDVSSPEPQMMMVEIPGRNGELDYSEVVAGGVRYHARNITMKFFSEATVSTWAQCVSQLRNIYAGRMARIVVDNDKAFYWFGRITEVAQNVKNRHSEIVIKAIVYPFKYNITIPENELLIRNFNPSAEELQLYSNITINGYRIISIECEELLRNFIITSSAEMTLTVGSQEYEIKAGSQLIECQLEFGENLLSFIGYGIVDINVIGGAL